MKLNTGKSAYVYCKNFNIKIFPFQHIIIKKKEKKLGM